MRRAAIAARVVDQTGVITAVVAALEPGLDEGVIAAAVTRAAPDSRQVGWLAAAVNGDPDVLRASSSAPMVVDRLVRELRAVGAGVVSAPVCCVCGTSRWLTQRIDGRRACAACAGRHRAERCGCGKVRPVATRDDQGLAVCGACRNASVDPARDCGGCGRHRRLHRTVDGVARCGECDPTPTTVCSRCGQPRRSARGRSAAAPLCGGCVRRVAVCSSCAREAKVANVWAAGPVCSSCRDRILAAKAVCAGCDQRRRIDPRAAAGTLCSDCAGLAPLSVCRQCGVEDRLRTHGCCWACVLRRRVEDLFGDGPLGPVGVLLTSTDRPRAAVRWLANPQTAQLLAALSCGEMTLNHAALDALPDAGSVAYLRQLLVVTGVLDERDEHTARLQNWVTARLGEMTSVEDRRVVETYAVWWVLRRRRSRTGDRAPTSTTSARQDVLGAIRLMGWLREHDRSLTDCTQADIDLWLSGPPGRRHARGFVRWATRHRLATGIDIVRHRDRTPARTVDADVQVELVRRFLVDDTVALIDRVAGLLLLCYAQPLSRITRLTLDDVDLAGPATTVRFGVTAVELPEPIGELLGALVADRPGPTAGAAGAVHHKWLFRGARPGQAMHSHSLGVRLGAYGINAQSARTSAMLDLAAQLPTVVLADMLGLYRNTAARWVCAAGGDWSSYVADRTRPPADQPAAPLPAAR